MKATHVIVVDDDQGVLDSLVSMLTIGGHRVTGFSSAMAFLEEARTLSASCLITDIRLPGIDGLTLMKRLAEVGHEHLPVIVVSGHADVGKTVPTGALAGSCPSRPFDQRSRTNGGFARGGRDPQMLCHPDRQTTRDHAASRPGIQQQGRRQIAGPESTNCRCLPSQDTAQDERVECRSPRNATCPCWTVGSLTSPWASSPRLPITELCYQQNAPLLASNHRRHDVNALCYKTGTVSLFTILRISSRLAAPVFA
jgi:CheY-like chemotaxis protein